jgi:hypothetical protein
MQDEDDDKSLPSEDEGCETEATCAGVRLQRSIYHKDLLPINALRGVITIVGKIATACCRKDIVIRLKNYKV